MNRFAKILAIVLVVVSVTPASLLVMPQPAHAQLAVLDPSNLIENAIGAIQGTISAVASVASQINEYALYIKEYVLDPLTFVLSGNLLKSVTGSIINFVNGQGNGTGAPQFVQNLSQHLQTTGDTQALAFFGEFGRNSNSPFAATILSSLRLNYLQGTSVNGFWSANQCTLGQVSANPLAFVGGNFAQGGWAAWFSLTTQPQNNPYALYYRAQAENNARVTAAQQQQLTQLGWGQGFLSWCGGGTLTSQSASSASAGCPAGQVFDTEFQTCAPIAAATADSHICSQGQAWSNEFQTCAPLDVVATTDCTKPDGSPGSIQTPGSTIHDALNKALGINLDKVAAQGNSSTAGGLGGAGLNSLFSSLSSTLSVIAYGANILGGNGSGGLLGVTRTSGATPVSLLQQQMQSGGYGVTASALATQAAQNQQAQTQAAQTSYAQSQATAAAQNAAAAHNGGIGGGSFFQGTGGGDAIAYQTAWQTIGDAANAALASLNQVATICSNQYATNATVAITSEVQPILQVASTASTANPSPNDVTQAQTNAHPGSGASTSSCGSLVVTGGTILDQMNLLKVNADKAAQACKTPPPFSFAICAP